MDIRRLLTAGIIICFTFTVAAQNPTTKDNLLKHVYTLAADSMLGRNAGSSQNIKVAEYIISQFRHIGIEPAMYSESGDTYLEPFTVYNLDCANVVGLLPGKDPSLQNEMIIIGAHYDHIGFNHLLGDTIVYNGADDNASGVAMMLELARNLKQHQDSLKRTVVFVAFDAEEIGLLGSGYMFTMLDKSSVKFMINLDMVGWYKKGPLHIKGAGTFQDGYGTIISVTPAEIKIKAPKNDKNKTFSSDHFIFSNAGIPTLTITTGIKSPYHRPNDEPDKIDYDGMTAISAYITNLAYKIINLNNIKPTE